MRRLSRREETLKLRARLEAAEQARLSGAPTYTLEESRKRLGGDLSTWLELVILEPAQWELEEIAQLHLNLAGPNSARKITGLILDTLSRLERFPLSAMSRRTGNCVTAATVW